MKTQTGIWIDGTKAIIVTFNEGDPLISEIASEIDNKVHHANEGDKGAFMGSQHLSKERTFNERENHQFDKYLNEVISKVKTSDELFVFGPAETKIKLKKLIESGKIISGSKLKSVEACDHMTMNQVVEKARNFYAVSK